MKSLSNKATYILFGAAALVIFAFFSIASGAIDFRYQANNANEVQSFTFLSATTTTATSTNVSNPSSGNGYLNILGALKVELFFSRGDTTGTGNAGNSIFSIQVTPDGVNWYDYNKLLLGTSTSQGMQSPIIVSGTSTVVLSLDLRTDTFLGVRCKVVEITDGEHTCKGLAEFGY